MDRFPASWRGILRYGPISADRGIRRRPRPSADGPAGLAKRHKASDNGADGPGPPHQRKEVDAIQATHSSVPHLETVDTGNADGPSRDVATIVQASLDADKADDVVSIDLAGKTTLADTMVIASGTSARHVSALAERLVERLRDAGVKQVQVEGLRAADWVLIDAGDVIVHVFRPEVRGFYNIERMWGDEGLVAGRARPSSPSLPETGWRA